MMLLNILLIVVSMAIIVLLLILIVCYLSQNSGDGVVRLSFKDFYKYYCLNPESWAIDYDLLGKRKDWYISYSCRIKFWSYPKYFWFVYNYKRGKINAKNKQTYIDFLQSIQADIDDCKSEAEKYMNKGTDILKNINYKT